ncbi:MAG: thiamine ABC transporter substrate binding subunit [Rhizobiales bacterium]|nr:thiamine ABC transporter substrate binding subunit [Hyphomicrobiales bacterium]
MKKYPTIAVFSFLAFIAPAEAKQTLTIYTYDSFVTEWGPGGKIKQAFETSCDCTIEWVAPGDGVALLNRLKLEGSGTQADLVLGLDTSLTAEAQALGLFGRHGIDKTRAKVPVPWADDVFLPYDYAHFAVIYDSEKITSPPKSLAELVDGPAEEKIVLQDPRSSTPGLGFVMWMKSVYGGKAGEAWSKLKRRVLTTTPGWSESYALFTKGDAPMVMSYLTSSAYHRISENSARYKAAIFSEGHYLQIEVAGLIEASPEKELARKFLDFMLTPGFQDQIPQGNWMFPASDTSSPLPANFNEEGAPPKTLLFSPEEAAANRKAWIEEWLNAIATP